MSRGICLVVCWAVAAVIAAGAWYLVGSVVGFPVFVSGVIAVMVFAGLAWALPAILCEEARVNDFEYSAEAKAAHAASAGTAPAVSASPAEPAESVVATPEPAVVPAVAAAPAAAHWSDGVAVDSGRTASGKGQSALKPSAALTEEATLRDGVGAWKYQGDAKPEAASPVAAAAAPAAAAPAAAGEKPATLTAARDGTGDDLKRIKGVGPKMEAMLNTLGFYHFDQIASWTEAEVAWVDDNLEGFKGRVSRDGWVEQAKLLAKGEETEFSKKVDKGGVY